jgi:SNF2 family DNA or RNA helicase
VYPYGHTQPETAAGASSSQAVSATAVTAVPPQTFKWLRLLQLACVHPALGLADTPANSKKRRALLASLSSSCKLVALRQLLWDCGIGLDDCTSDSIDSDDTSSVQSDSSEAVQPQTATDTDVDMIDDDSSHSNTAAAAATATTEQSQEASNGTSEQPDSSSSKDSTSDTLLERLRSADAAADAAPRKCLVFAQHKAVLDVTEQCLFKQCMPSVKYVRLDGSMSQEKRTAVLTQFSTDNTVTVLLLTTKAGGLGLNLTAADTVVFLEHDWNPQVSVIEQSVVAIVFLYSTLMLSL